MLAETLRSVAGLRLPDKDGGDRTLELLPPATDAALHVSRGLANGPLESCSLVDLEGFGLEEAFPHAYSIAHDRFGNYWILDLLAGSVDWAPVLYACHDPPVIAYQAASLEEFLLDVVAMWRPGPRSPVDVVHEEVVHRIWRERPEPSAQEAASLAGDPVLQAFAAALPPAAVIGDLRRLFG